MKKQILFIVIFLFAGLSSLTAQEARQRLSVEERTKAAIEKLTPLNLDEESKNKTSVVLKEFFEEQEKAMKEFRESGNADRETIRAKRQELAAARDEKLKKIFTAEQMKKWLEEIEPTLRPQRQPRN
ncbi:MAG: hypothetical protein V9E88_02220 [Ferruginibacter sp.]